MDINLQDKIQGAYSMPASLLSLNLTPLNNIVTPITN